MIASSNPVLFVSEVENIMFLKTTEHQTSLKSVSQLQEDWADFIDKEDVVRSDFIMHSVGKTLKGLHS